MVSSVSMNILVHGFSHIYEEKFQRRHPDVQLLLHTLCITSILLVVDKIFSRKDADTPLFSSSNN